MPCVTCESPSFVRGRIGEMLHQVEPSRTAVTVPVPTGNSVRIVSGSEIQRRQRLGHASIGTTANIYTHDNDSAATDAAERLGKALG